MNYESHLGHNHPRTAKAREICRRSHALVEAGIKAVAANPRMAAARSRAKTNEYRHEHGAVNMARCSRCGSYRYDDAVDQPDVDGLCGPFYCHYAIQN